MPTLINDCVLITASPNWAEAPRSTREWKTNVGSVVDGAEQRQGLRAAGHRTQRCRLTAKTLPKRAEIEAELIAALKSGRAAMPRIGWGSPVLAATTTTVDLADTVPFAVGDYAVIRISGVVYARQISVVATPSAGVRRLTVSVLPSAPATTDRVWPMLAGTLTIERIRSLDGEAAEFTIELAEPLGTGELGTSDACVPAALVNTGAGLNLCGRPTDLAAEADVACGLTAVTLRWSEVFAANAYKVYRATSSGGALTLVASLDGAVFSYDVPRDAVTYYYKVTAVTGDRESAASDEVVVAGTSIEGVMRALQERYLASEDPALDPPLSAIVWPDRDIGSPAGPGDYPAAGFYAADIAGDDARAAELVQAIAAEFDDAWLVRYAAQEDWLGILDVASIPRLSRAVLDIPETGEITSLNWKTTLYALAAAVCRCEHLVRTAGTTVPEYRYGLGVGVHFYMVTEQEAPYGLARYIEAASQAWNSVPWGVGSGTVVVPSGFGGDENISNTAVDVATIGMAGATGSALLPSNDYWVSFFAGKVAARGAVTCDLSASVKGEARVYLRIDQVGDASGFARPVPLFNTLAPWEALTVGVAATSPLIASEEPLAPTSEFQSVVGFNRHHDGTFASLDLVAASWTLAAQVVRWTRRHHPTLAHWSHYP